MIGKTLGNYQITAEIGVGGMATIYKAYDADTGRYVAVKVLPERLSKDPKFRERFRREAKAIANLEHIHILPVFSYGEDPETGSAYLVMRLLESGSLTDRLEHGRLNMAEVGRFVTQMGAALDYAHQRGVVHRDVKPSNVLLDNSNNAFLTDFGIAKFSGASMAGLTATGAAIGTPQYMSPEQVQAQKIDARSDVYSLAVMAYHMLSGDLPFDAETPMALAFKHVSEPAPLLSDILPDIPRSVAVVVQQGMAKNPGHRPASAGEFASRLAHAIANPTDKAHLTETTPGAGAPTVPEFSPDSTVPMERRASPPASATPSPGVPAPQMKPTPMAGTQPPPQGVAVPPMTAAPVYTPSATVRPVPVRRRRSGLVVIAVLLGIVVLLVGGGVLALSMGLVDLDSIVAQQPTPIPPVVQTGGTTAADVLLSDSFDDPNSGFPDVSNETGGIRYQNSSLVIDVVGGGVEWYAPSRGVDASDVIIEVDATLENGSVENEYGVLCRWQDSGNYYALAISSDGQHAIWKVVNDVLTVLADWAPSESIHQDVGSANSIRAVCDSDTLSLSVNGTLIDLTGDNSLTGGDVAVFAGMFGDGQTTVSFDNMIVSSP
jgi:serine/threonine-protein kinase